MLESWGFKFVQIKGWPLLGLNKFINIWHVTSFGYSLIKEYIRASSLYYTHFTYYKSSDWAAVEM